MYSMFFYAINLYIDVATVTSDSPVLSQPGSSQVELKVGEFKNVLSLKEYNTCLYAHVH